MTEDEERKIDAEIFAAIADARIPPPKGDEMIDVLRRLADQKMMSVMATKMFTDEPLRRNLLRDIACLDAIRLSIERLKAKGERNVGYQGTKP